MDPSPSQSEQYKVVVMGDGGVGKTAVTTQFVVQHFIEVYDPTVENAYRKVVQVDGKPCLLEILDTAGQEEYVAMRDHYLRAGKGFLVVYSVTDEKSFKGVNSILLSVQRVIGIGQTLPVVLVGNKADLAGERVVKSKDGARLARNFGVPFLEVSAKTGAGVSECFCGLVREIRKKTVAGASNEHEQPCDYRRHEKKKRACLLM
eukprot:m51a1_g1870 putative gtpase kras-like isoform x1 (204) ;mRNA; f:662315-663277